MVQQGGRESGELPMIRISCCTIYRVGENLGSSKNMRILLRPHGE